MTLLRNVRPVHYAWVMAAVTFIILLGASGFRSAPGVLIVPLQEEFGWSRATISIAISINLLLFGFMGPFAAAMMERLSDLAQMFVGIETNINDTTALTSRETEVLELISKGFTNQQIAQHLVIEVGTVKNHVHNILEKLNVSSRGEAAAYMAFITR